MISNFRTPECLRCSSPWCERGVRNLKLISDMVKLVYISEMQLLPQNLAFGIKLRLNPKF